MTATGSARYSGVGQQRLQAPVHVFDESESVTVIEPEVTVAHFPRVPPALFRRGVAVTFGR
jgi:hypothetical protein